MYIYEESTHGAPFKSDRTGPDKDGVFVISLDDLFGAGAEMSYSFVDNERNTLKAEAKIDGIPASTFILKRIPSEEEIKIHIVSFKLDDSFALAGYTIHSELAAVEDGTSFEKKGLPILKLTANRNINNGNSCKINLSIEFCTSHVMSCGENR